MLHNYSIITLENEYLFEVAPSLIPEEFSPSHAHVSGYEVKASSMRYTSLGVLGQIL